MKRLVCYGYSRPAAEQPFFKSLGWVIILKQYFPIFVACFVVLLGSLLLSLHLHLRISSLRRFLEGMKDSERARS